MRREVVPSAAAQGDKRAIAEDARNADARRRRRVSWHTCSCAGDGAELCRQRHDRVKLLGVILPEKADPAGQGA